ncbi:hypothetical protein [Paludisphaera soli]|uniref:hypothetical protein n=1 Tax=Paludisphaera soli TaxID=2712865 RepID=UPI0013EA810D|nr:hypothetical protein [Paludisphaera soli]
MSVILTTLTWWLLAIPPAALPPFTEHRAEVGGLTIVVSARNARQVSYVENARMVVMGSIRAEPEADGALPRNVRVDIVQDGVTYGQQIGEPTPIEGHPGTVAFTVTMRVPRRPGIFEVRLAPEGLTRDGRRCEGADRYPRYLIQVVSNSPPGPAA